MLSMLSISPKIYRATVVVASVLFGVATLFQLPSSSAPTSRFISYFTLFPGKQIDWSRFAYTQYVTDRSYLCNSLMLFEALHRLGSKADRLMMYPSEFLRSESDDSPESRLLRFARDRYGVKLMPVEVQMKGGSGAPWSESYTKLLAFNQTQYDRVLNLDSDATILQSMDELFLLPRSTVAMPRAYWINPDQTLSSQLLLIEPSDAEFIRVMDAFSTAGPGEYDMDIVNHLYGGDALVIPHRPYNLLTGEFRSNNHDAYLGNSKEDWDSERMFTEAKYLHFSDWPLPKPWITAVPQVVEEAKPSCEFNPKTHQQDDCRTRDIWLGIYKDFLMRRKGICHTAQQIGSL